MRTEQQQRKLEIYANCLIEVAELTKTIFDRLKNKFFQGQDIDEEMILLENSLATEGKLLNDYVLYIKTNEIDIPDSSLDEMKKEHEIVSTIFEFWKKHREEKDKQNI